MAVYKIFGPPGTGKTTCLLGHMEKALEEGTPVTSIGFFSFTNKAADEAKERAMAKFPWLDSEGFCYFRTLHSLALQRIGGFRANPCMTHKDWVEFGRLLGITFSFTSMKWDDDMAWAGATDGDKMRSLCDLARLKRQPLKKVWQNSELDTINFFEVERFEKWSRQYKKDHQLIDFCDMLERACLVPEKLPSFDLLFIDEAQDLSTLQWDFAKLLIQKAKNTYVAGDDDQAIFCWAGADVQSFISLDGENRVLNKSYRVPRSVHALADKLRKPIKESVEKVWQAREEEGLVKYHYELDPYKIGLDNGDWLILTRNNYQLEPIVNICMEEGFSFWTKGSFLKPTSLKAIVAWEDLRRGKDVAVGDICLIYDLFGSGVGLLSFMQAVVTSQSPIAAISKRICSCCRTAASICRIEGARGGTSYSFASDKP